MARYTGPKSKIARKFQEPIYGEDKYLEKKNYPPGQHGPDKKRRSKQSEYALQLRAKQIAKYTYGILEKQFANLFDKASRAKGITGEILLQYCELRLDNTVYRLGIAPTRAGARQLVSHRHITVNGKMVNIASYALKVGDVVSIREKSRGMSAIRESIANNATSYEWLQWNSDSLSGTYLNIPEREAIPENIEEGLIVELYSK
ncbi:MAG: 30S ribosomal protein S4 [Flavobacteriales bacterium]|nr:30S ribosomal protein S4 [Flavobacteriales bacterium]